MNWLAENRWVRRTGLALICALGLGAVAAVSAPGSAQARVWVGFSFGYPGWGRGYWHPPYYGYWGHPVYYHGWYRRQRWWCAHHPYRCRWY